MDALNVPDLVRLVEMEDRGQAVAELRRALEEDRVWRVSLFDAPWAVEFAGDPRVAPIVAEARDRVAALHLEPTVIVEPAARAGIRPLLLALHGARGSARDEIGAYRPAVALGYTVAAAQSSQPSTPHGFCWDPPRERVLEDLRAIVPRLPAHGRLVLAGFSQGAWVALTEALEGSLFPAAGLILAAPFVGDLERLPRAARRLRVEVLAGSADPLAGRLHLLESRLRDAGHHVHVELISGLGHQYPADFAQRLPRLLESVTRRS